VAADDDGLDPSWDGSRNALKDDRLAEDGAAEDGAYLREHEKKPRQGKRNKAPAGVLTVPLGERHISFNLNSFTRSSSGVMVAHLIPTLTWEPPQPSRPLLDHLSGNAGAKDTRGFKERRGRGVRRGG
jgi:hypothetical protein